ncbi:MAG: hypothetical protein KGJ60_05695, partial [Verrucomicrobiota bacterium]|nr:hypothetical protein [Verrucomicrobiota bacterium]
MANSHRAQDRHGFLLKFCLICKADVLVHDAPRSVQTDDGTEWRHDLDLSKITSVCHRRTAAGLEFAVLECPPLKSGEMKSV